MAKRGWLLLGIAAGAVLVLLSVPVASAKPSARVHLSLIPLPKSALGSAARGLKLAYDSGNSGVISTFSGGTTFHKGHISGYALHYGNEASGLPGVDSVWTSIDEYENATDAKLGLNFWMSDDALVTQLNQGGLSVTYRRVKVSAVGSARFGDLTSYSASNIAPVSSFDEWFTEGRYLLDVRVAAGRAAEAKALALKLAAKLDGRLGLALKGRLHARAVKLPRRPEAGPPAGGPNLSAMGLATTDLSGPATLLANGYLAKPPGAEPDQLALSDYFVTMNPAGPFDALTQHIEWFATANEARFDADRWLAGEAAAPGALPVDLASIGDGARGVYLTFTPSGIVALVTFSTGQMTEILELDSPSDVPGEATLADITSVAQAAANKINAAQRG